MNQLENINFSLPPSITIENVGGVADELIKICSEPLGILSLDACAVEIITTPGAQLFISLHNTLHPLGGKLIVKNAADVFIQHFQMLGMQAQLAAWSEAHA